LEIPPVSQTLVIASILRGKVSSRQHGK
jgi:hypothetical protein